MEKCQLCGKENATISSFLGLCLQCIRAKPEKALSIAEKAHAKSRQRFGLMASIPKAKPGIECTFCANKCIIAEGSKGFCNLVENSKGKMIREQQLIASCYFDPHPTNCVAAWACGASGIGYPEYSYSKEREFGYKNFSIFCIGCNFDCLFCQNWHFREDVTTKKKPVISDEQFIAQINEKTSCICFFGGDPMPQLDKIIRICKKAKEEINNKILRFCLETNGNANKQLLKNFALLSLESGGGIKFDLKFKSNALNKIICGTENKAAFQNFAFLASIHEKRLKVPFLRASTLLVPGYVDEQEVKGIAEFIASINENIPYSLLAFYPHFEMSDLPLTTKKEAEQFQRIAKKAGLHNTRIGNVHLLQ